MYSSPSSPRTSDTTDQDAALLRRPRRLDLGPCFACGGDGAVQIEPIHDDGMIWTIMPCDLCHGSGVLTCGPAE